MLLHLGEAHSRAPPWFRKHPRHDRHDTRVGRMEAEVEDRRRGSYRCYFPLIPFIFHECFLHLSNFLVRIITLCLIFYLPSVQTIVRAGEGRPPRQCLRGRRYDCRIISLSVWSSSGDVL